MNPADDLAKRWRLTYEARANAADYLASISAPDQVSTYAAASARARTRAADAAAGTHDDDEPWLMPVTAIQALDHALNFLRRRQEPEARMLAEEVAAALLTIE